ncbi:MAG: hypothetical protein LUG89_05905 [Methanosphaera sp.]|nr:hypothetical protein [Methanosphaera sp.]
MNNKIYCSNCGYVNSNEETYCNNCYNLLHNFDNIKPNKAINTIEDLFNQDNYLQLKNNILSLDVYELIIENIISFGQNNITYKNNMTTIEKVKSIAKAYTILISKKTGKNYGQYAFNIIAVDNLFNESLQIATILHELTHYLFNEIISQILMYYWRVPCTSMLDGFVQTLVTIPEVLLISEYCASKTEEEYLPEEYVSYSSFNDICNDLNYDKNILTKTFYIGKSMSESIIKILDSFINDALRKSIINEFKKNNTQPIRKPICVDDNSTNSNPVIRNVLLMDELVDNYELIRNSREIYPVLESNKDHYDMAYKTQSDINKY